MGRETATPPRLYGDGVTDDTDSVQWYIDRELQLPEGQEYAVDLYRIRGAGFFLGSNLAPRAALTAKPRAKALNELRGRVLDE